MERDTTDINELAILEQFIFCHIDATIWTGRKKLRVEDLQIEDDIQLPSQEVVDLGSKKICDPQALAVFERLKKRAYRVCEHRGIRFMGGYAIPVSQTDYVLEQLGRVKEEFIHEKQGFLDVYEQVTLEWIAKHPAFSKALQSAITPVEVLKDKFSFEYSIFKLKLAPEDTQLCQKMANLYQTLLDGIAQDAKVIQQQSIFGRTSFSQRSVNSLTRISDKLYALRFLNSNVQTLSDTVQEVIVQLPKKGDITGELFERIEALVAIWTEPKQMKLLGEGTLTLDQMCRHASGATSNVFSVLGSNQHASFYF